MIPAYRTNFGTCYLGDISILSQSQQWDELEGRVDLLFTSPPFALARKKQYGNLAGEEYIEWFSGLAETCSSLLSPTGSIVIEMGNTWLKGKPEMSLHPLKALIEFMENGDLHLCQQFVWDNPARLPSPAQWVNIERIRVKDSFTHIWWMSKNIKPKANNRRVLNDYSQAMLDLLERQSYNSGTRPSEHKIGETSFLTNNNGSIPSNVFSISNTRSSSPYLSYCKKNDFKKHPARMPREIVGFFVNLLTDPNDLICDPFAGSNTTGDVAESLGRKWVAIEKEIEYIRGSRGRFDNPVDDQAILELEIGYG